MPSQLQDVHAVRMARYQELRSEFEASPVEQGQPAHGRLRRFAAHTGMSERYLSHIDNGRKSIGAATARKLERAMNKPANWLDTPASVGTNESEGIIQDLALRAWRMDSRATHAALLAILLAARSRVA